MALKLNWRLLARPVQALRFSRRLLVELRGIRRALERQADALEVQAGTLARDRTQSGGQGFRAFSRMRDDLSEQDLKNLTEVNYVHGDLLAQVASKEAELRELLGREPTDEEMDRALEGRVE